LKHFRYDSGCPDDENVKKTENNDITGNGRCRRPAQFTDVTPFSSETEVHCNNSFRIIGPKLYIKHFSIVHHQPL